MRKILSTAAVVISLTGCAQLMTTDYLAMRTVSRMVSAYCALPDKARKVNRLRWNAVLSPNSVAIECKK